MLLFDTIIRTDPHHARSDESLYAFLDRVDTPFWERVRVLLNDWFSRLPESEQRDIRGRFQSKTQRQAWAAFWELYLHELFLRLGFNIEHHPVLPSSSARIDFHLTGNEQDFYVEAVIVAEPDEDDRANRLNAAIRDAIDKIPSGDFFVFLEVPRAGNSYPPFRRMIHELTAWLNTLDADAVTITGEQSAYIDASLPRFDWQSGDWKLEFTAMPKKLEARQKPNGGTFGGGPIQSRWVDDYVAIGTNLRRKARKYGRLNKPYVIALMSARHTTSLDHLLRGVFGHTYEHPGMVLAGNVPQGWPAEGLWLSHNGPTYSEVSAVLAVMNLMAWNVPRTEPLILYNPWPTHALTRELPFRTVAIDMQTGYSEWTQATKRIAEIFNLPTDWPGGEPFPS